MSLPRAMATVRKPAFGVRGGQPLGGFAFVMFAIIQFHLGIKVTPATGPQTGLFDVPKVLRAAQRGAACKVDLSDRWDPFPVTGMPLDQVRADYGIPPL